MMIVFPIKALRFVFLADAGDDLSLLRPLSKTDLQLEQLLRLGDTFGGEDLRGLELNLHELVDGDLRWWLVSALQGLMLCVVAGVALVSQLLVAGESVCRSRSWLLVVLSQYVGKGSCPFGSLFRLAVHPTLCLGCKSGD